MSKKKAPMNIHEYVSGVSVQCRDGSLSSSIGRTVVYVEKWWISILAASRTFGFHLYYLILVHIYTLFIFYFIKNHIKINDLIIWLLVWIPVYAAVTIKQVICYSNISYFYFRCKHWIYILKCGLLSDDNNRIPCLENELLCKYF